MDEISLEDIIELLEGVREGVDYENCTTLIDDRVLDSFDVLAVVSAIDDDLGVEVPAREIVPENFNSAQTLLAMVQRLAAEG